jgi:transcriptional regulator with XRE-family HTH domain
MFIIELEPDIWLAIGEGTPATTPDKSRAAVFDTKAIARGALFDARGFERRYFNATIHFHQAIASVKDIIATAGAVGPVVTVTPIVVGTLLCALRRATGYKQTYFANVICVGLATWRKYERGDMTISIADFITNIIDTKLTKPQGNWFVMPTAGSNIKLGGLIKDMRVRRKLTATFCAKKVGISLRTWYHIENGTGDISVSQLAEICILCQFNAFTFVNQQLKNFKWVR